MATAIFIKRGSNGQRMDFEQWRIGRRYSSFELTEIVQTNCSRYRIRFLYNSSRSGSLEMQTASGQSTICPAEVFLEKRWTSLEMEFLRLSPQVSEKKGNIYLWLKFFPDGEIYRLNAIIKSIRDKDYLCYKPLVQYFFAFEEA